jgi:hypothetical protein
MTQSNRWASADVIGEDAAAARYPVVAADIGLSLTHRPSRVSGEIVAFSEGQQVVLCDQDGNLHRFKPHPGVLLLNGKPVELVAGKLDNAKPSNLTASGSIDVGPTRAKTARASRIWVEGIHDAELVEKIWGDDLRHEAVVVEPIHGLDDLEDLVAGFHPGPGRKLGILVDHMVTGSKESRISAAIRSDHVLIRGHPFVDVWQAIRPAAIGIAAWPEIGPGRPWKEGVIAALGRQGDPGAFWREILQRVNDYTDIETSLVNAMEQLIDFVTQ